MKKLFLIIVIVMQSVISFAQNGSICLDAEPFCSDQSYSFPMGTNTTAESGPDYSCLYTQPNPYWYYLQVDQSGDITIYMESPTGNDIDFICWGPFTSPTGPCTSQLTTSNEVDCSYSVLSYETCNISNALSGEFYLMLITNYSNSPGNIEFSQTNFGASGAGSTDCSIVLPCDITNITTTVGACNPTTNTYSVTGTIIFNDQPLTGTLVITDNAGVSQTFNAPFASPISYILNGITSNGAQHSITAVFSDDQFCTYTVTYIAPNPCSTCFAVAGEDQNLCGLTTTLAAVPNPTDQSGVWSCLNPSISINQPTAYNTTITASTPGVYTLTWTIINQAGLTCYDDVIITFNQIPTSLFTTTVINCWNTPSTITYTGNATAAATYTWNFGGGSASPGTGQGPQSVTWTTPGLHTVTLVVSQNGCNSILTSMSINNPPELDVIVDTSPVTCASGSNGQANVQIIGGTPTYTPTWSNGSGPPFPAGNYTVTITDVNGCTDLDNFDITQPNSIVVTPSQTNLTCANNFSGAASVSVVGGITPYNYIWSNGGGNIPGLIGLAANSYTVTIIDANGCTTTNTINITQPTVMQSTITQTVDPTCVGLCNGSAVVSSSQGTPPYTYIWSNGQNTFAASNLCSGWFQVTTTDDNGCTITTPGTLLAPTPIVASINLHTNVTCNGLCDGSATASATGSLGGFSYQWSNNQNTATATNLCAIVYTVTASDVNGCTSTANVTITQPVQLIVSPDLETGVLCYGDCNGTGSVNVIGGVPPYTYYWNGGFNQQLNPNLCSGNHFITVTDANSCVASTSLYITSPSELIITNINTTQPTCYGFSDATATISISGGLGSYDYTLGGQTNSTGVFTGLNAGSYVANVTDANGCTKISNISISQPNQLIVSTTADFTLCNGQIGTIYANVIGGTGSMNYYWNGVLGTSSIQISPTTETNYSVYVVDANGCTSNISSTNVNITPAVQIEAFASPNAICPGEPVAINVNITQGAGAPYIITYDGNIVTLPLTIYPAQTGSYIITVEDNCGSIASDDIPITVYQNIPVSFISDTTNGCEPLTVNFNPIPDVAGYQYFWNFNDGGNSQISFDSHPEHTFNDGIYDVILTVTDNNGCISTNTLYDFINVYPLPHSAFTTNQNMASDIKPEIIFYNLSQGAIEYIWAFADGDSSSIVNPIHSFYGYGDFNITLIAFSNHGCPDTSSLIITIYEECSFYAPTAFSPDYDNINDYFRVFGKCITDNFKLYIYDRWGEVIWEGNDINDMWDGRAKNHIIVPMGVYSWLCTYTEKNGLYKVKSGIVTVIR